jgi:hypothetical protein
MEVVTNLSDVELESIRSKYNLIFGHLSKTYIVPFYIKIKNINYAKIKTKKNHKKKVNVRNKNVEDSKKQEKKAKIDFVDNIIKKEQENGKFDNNTVIENNFGPII